MKLVWTCVDLWAGLMIFSLILYAFAGLHFWAPLEADQYGRVEMARSLSLVFLHIAPIFAAVVRRAAA